jgi:hypothetical protein
MYCYGTVEAGCDDKQQATELIQNQIDNGCLTEDMVEWGEPIYEEGSLKPADVD